MKNKNCEWKTESLECGYRYETLCDNIFCFVEGGIKEHEFKFCPFCGLEIKEIE